MRTQLTDLNLNPRQENKNLYASVPTINLHSLQSKQSDIIRKRFWDSLPDNTHIWVLSGKESQNLI